MTQLKNFCPFRKCLQNVERCDLNLLMKSMCVVQLNPSAEKTPVLIVLAEFSFLLSKGTCTDEVIN